MSARCICIEWPGGSAGFLAGRRTWILRFEHVDTTRRCLWIEAPAGADLVALASEIGQRAGD
jgi:hypothetical protein